MSVGGLGSFTQGLFGGAQAVMSIYGAYQGIQQTQDDLDAASDAKKALNDNKAAAAGAAQSASGSTAAQTASNIKTSGDINDAYGSSAEGGGGYAGTDSTDTTVQYPSNNTTSQASSSSKAPTRLADPSKISVPSDTAGFGATPPAAPSAPSTGGLGITPVSSVSPSAPAPTSAPPPVRPVAPSGTANPALVPNSPAMQASTSIPGAYTGGARPGFGTQTPGMQGSPIPASNAQPAPTAPPPASAVGGNGYGAGMQQSQQQAAVNQANTSTPQGMVSSDGGYAPDPQGQTPPPGALPSGQSAQPAIPPMSPNQPGQPQPQMASQQGRTAQQSTGPAVSVGQTASAQPNAAPLGPMATGTTAAPAQGGGIGASIMSALNPSAAAAEPKGGPNTGTSPAVSPAAQAIPAAAPAVNPASPVAKAVNAGAANPGALKAAQTQTPDPQAGSAAVVIPASAAPVAPGQTSPTVQSEPTPAVVKPTIDPRPLEALKQQAPGAYNLVMKVAGEEDVDPTRLALHWYLESGLHDSAPDSQTGAKGIMQVEPATQKYLDPRGQIDGSTMEGSLRLGARYINLNDREFGRNSVSSIAAYTAGPANVHAIATDYGNAEGKFPKTMAYVRKALNITDDPDGNQFSPGDPTRSKLDVNPRVPGLSDSVDDKSDPLQGKFTPGGGNNGPGLMQAAQQGPDQFVKYMVSTSPQGMNMTDSWRRAETSMIVAAIARHDYAGVGQARDLVTQMSQQGATQSLQAASQAFGAGNMAGAAQMLAKAHAFFPDGSVGRFGTDASGNLWAQQLDENDPSRALAPPFQVTQQGIQQMMITTSDPNKYLEMVNAQQQHVSSMALNAARAKYYGGLDQERIQAAGIRQQGVEDNIAERATAAHEAVAERGQQAAAATEQRREAAQLRAEQGRKESDGFARQTESDATNYYTAGSKTDQFRDPVTGQAPANVDQARSIAAQVFTGLRVNAQAGAMSPPHANFLAMGVAKGQLQVTRDSQGRYGIADPKTGFVHAYIPSSLGESLYGQSRNQAGQTARPTQGIGAGQATAGNPNPLMGTPQSSAIPQQNAPTTMAMN